VPQDWSNVSRLEFRIKESASNSNADIGTPIYFTWVNNGVTQGGSCGVARFPLGHDTTYRTVSLDLGTFPRNQVSSIMFYADGTALPAGSFTFYLDNICATPDTYGVLDDVEQYEGSNWSASVSSSTGADSQNADTGVSGLRWTFSGDGTTPWGNDIGIHFTPPRDLTRYSTICIRFKEDASNALSDIGNNIYFDMNNGGVSTSQSLGVAQFKLKAANGYRTVELSLGAFNRDKVDYLRFYVDGKLLSAGPHVWYLDNISFY
jgi:hypothetical protein